MPSTRTTTSGSLNRTPIVGLLAFLVPGLGHLYLGDRARGIIFCVVITVTFWGGVAIGGVRSTIDTQERKAWFLAQLCSGSNTLVILTARWIAPTHLDPEKGDFPRAYWPAEDIAVVYTGVAGLLNLLIILDALVRSELASMLPRPIRHGREPPDKRKR